MAVTNAGSSGRGKDQGGGAGSKSQDGMSTLRFLGLPGGGRNAVFTGEDSYFKKGGSAAPPAPKTNAMKFFPASIGLGKKGSTI